MPHSYESYNKPWYILPIIVFAQFAGTSLWFAPNAILLDLQLRFNFDESSIGSITGAVQFGFITGTLLFAITTLSDRVAANKLFLICAALGALFNWLCLSWASSLNHLLALRFIVGFTLAGIYPVGMKIAASWHKNGLGSALGFLVGALVIGTAFPYLLKSTGSEITADSLITFVSFLALFGGVLLYFTIPEGPYLKSAGKFDLKAALSAFRKKEFLSATSGYFGHMWELYAFWTFLPLYIINYNNLNTKDLNTSLLCFLIIASGTIGCVFGGQISKTKGSLKVAVTQLSGSLICILLSPLMMYTPEWLFITYLIMWGILVAGDSPQLSALIAQKAPRQYVGSGLTLSTSLGFAISIVSIFLVEKTSIYFTSEYLFFILTPGPLIGLWFLQKVKD